MDGAVCLRRKDRRGPAVRRLENGVPLTLQHLPSGGTYGRRILNNEDGLRTARERRGRGGGGALRRLVHPRHVDLETRAVPRLGIQPDETTRLLDDPVHRREAKSGAFAQLLGR